VYLTYNVNGGPRPFGPPLNPPLIIIVYYVNQIKCTNGISIDNTKICNFPKSIACDGEFYMNSIINNLIHGFKIKLQKLYHMLSIDNHISICAKSTFFKYNLKSVTFLKLHTYIYVKHST
jgi:hypothetical protein